MTSRATGRIELPVSRGGRSAEEVARRAAAIAGEIILPRYRELNAGTLIEKVRKGRGNYVTETDIACEEAVIRLLREEFPDIRVLAEESAVAVDGWDRGWLWVLDPLDGTENFSRGIPSFVFNLALCLDGDPVLGLTHQPVTGDEFFAAKGRGLFVNGERAHVSRVSALSDSLMGIGLGYQYERASKLLELLSGLWPRVQMVQNIGSAALGLAYAASGRFELYVHSTLYPWDMAAGIVQVREGGGEFVDRDGGPITIYSEGVIAGAPGPVREFARLTAGTPWR